MRYTIISALLLVGCGNPSLIKQLPNLPVASLPVATTIVTPDYTYTDVPCPLKTGPTNGPSYPPPPSLPNLIKKGYWGCVSESTPVEFKGTMYVVTQGAVHRNDGATVYGAKVYDFFTRRLVSFGPGASMYASAYSEGGVLYHLSSGNNKIYLMTTTDLKTWSEAKEIVAMQPNDTGLFNTSLTKGNNEYVIAYEVTGLDELGGYGYTWRIATSPTLQGPWVTVGSLATRSYHACPNVKYIDGVYYFTYVEIQHDTLITYFAKTTDFVNYSFSTNAFIAPSTGEGVNASDVDYVEVNGIVYILYMNGNQQGWADVLWAVYPGTIREMLATVQF